MTTFLTDALRKNPLDRQNEQMWQKFVGNRRIANFGYDVWAAELNRIMTCRR